MKFLSFVLSLSFLIAFLPSSAEARLDILPRKILIEDRARSGEITIMNLGDKTEVIRITMLSYRQQADGMYETLETSVLNPAFDPEKVVRLSPKQFTLPPGGRQKVRFSIQRPANLPDGEYRFHVRAVSYTSEDNANGKPIPSKGAGLAMKMNLGVAIPVVVRKGKLNSAAKIENITLLNERQTESRKPALKFDVARTGTAGVMGVVNAYWEDGTNPPRQIGIMSNLNVFSEVDKRSVILVLDEIPQGNGNIRVVYKNEFGDKEVIDEVVLQK